MKNILNSIGLEKAPKDTNVVVAMSRGVEGWGKGFEEGSQRTEGVV